jgi:GT2 family glycosyltransferase
MTDSAQPSRQSHAYDVSVVIVSFNTREVLRECLEAVAQESAGLHVETIVVDNGSRDGSIEMLRADFPAIELIVSEENLGFGRANNLAFEKVRGRYIVLLNSDAFLTPDALRLSVEHMDADPKVGLGGGRLVGRDGSWQPSARRFPTLTTDLFVYSGLADRYAHSRIFGCYNRTWADPMQAAEVDWVPGAYSIIRAQAIRPEALAAAEPFDPRFFLYYEEVDLCHRIKAAGYTVWYWPDVVVIHIGGESSRQLKMLEMSRSGAQLTLWRMRSTLLYYRKHHGLSSLGARFLEVAWNRFRALRRSRSPDPQRRREAAYFQAQADLMEQAWKETRGGRTSPPQPW